MDNGYRKWLEIDERALLYNINYIKSKLNKNTKIMTVVKADAYGCGSVECSKLFLSAGADYLAVSSLGEATILRNNNIDAPILILGFTDMVNIIEVINENLILTVYDLDIAKEINKIAKSINKKVKIHIKVNTGMNRIGFYSGISKEKNNISINSIIEISKLENIIIDGIYSHFACEDVNECSKQFNFFKELIEVLESNNIELGLKHICNSFGTLNCPEFQLDMVRPGIALYGYENFNLRPAMSFKAIVTSTYLIDKDDSVSYSKTYTAKDKQRIAVLPIGYADGLNRSLSNNISFNINGNKYKQVGNICMDACMILVDDNIKIKDVVNIFGSKSENSVSDIANKTNTITYEIICRMGKRIPRVYVNSNKI